MVGRQQFKRSCLLGGQGFGKQNSSNSPPTPKLYSPTDDPDNKTPFDQYLEMNTIQKANTVKKSLQIDMFDSLLNPVPVSTQNKVCDHQWQQYNGFSENYEFCTKCDCKKK